MKKTKKALASLAIAGMVLTMVPFNAFATGTVSTRLAGTTAQQTAVAIADQTGWTGTAILASSASYGMVDALTSGPLAKFLNAPILLQEPGAVLNADTKAELVKLAVKKVYVTSGTAVINQAVLDQLVGMGITVESLGGVDRFETSVNIAKKMIALGAPVSKVAVAYGWLNQDALSIASIASYAGQPILLTEKDAVPASVKAFLTANAAVISSDVIGGTGVISDAVKAAVPNATRHYGATAYDTNSQVIQDFASSLSFGNVYVANGVTAIDALAGAPLAAASKSAIVLTDGVNVPAVATFIKSKLATDSVVTALGGLYVVPEAVRVGVATGVVTPPTGTLSVTSVSAISANSFKVVFNQAPVDTAKVTFAVTRATTPVTTTTTWNTAKTEATITSSTNLPEGSYGVAVKDDTTDLGSKTVSITQQKIAKISITSSKLAVATDPLNNTKQIGYASYQVLDQYDNDITSSYLANSVSFQTGVGNVTWKDGLLQITPNSGMSLIQFSNVVVTGYDSNTGVSTSATLATSTALGTLSNIKLNALTNADNKVLTAGDTANVWYISYDALDMSGNNTKNYNLVRGGLILNGSDDLTCSAPQYVTAKVVTDPLDSTKAAIQVTVTSATVNMDLPVSITAMSYNGTASTLSLTLKKAATTDSLTLMAPTYDIAIGEQKEVPFVAYDQNGIAVTKYSNLTAAGVTFSPNYMVDGHAAVVLEENVDGTARLMVGPFPTKGPQVISAMTQTGKISTLTLNIQDTAKAASLGVDSSVLINAMQVGASQQVDFGYIGGNGGLSVKDQYGRTIDMIGSHGNYVVLATATGNVTATNSVATGINGGAKITLGAAAAAGQGSVVFKLYDSNDLTKALDTKTVQLSVIASADIKDYSMDQLTTPIYTASDYNSGGFTAPATTGTAVRASDYYANPYVYGLTSSKSKVVLAGSPITAVYSTSGSFVATTDGAYDGVIVYASKFSDLTKITGSGTLTVTLNGADGKLKTVTTPVTSTTAAPVASTVGLSVDERVDGVSVSGDTVTLDTTVNSALLTPGGIGLGDVISRFDTSGNIVVRTAGSTTFASGSRAPIYLYAKDQYGTKAMKLGQITKAATSTVSDYGFSVDSTGKVLIHPAAIANGQFADITAVTTNGLMKTIRIKFVMPVTNTVVGAAVATIDAYSTANTNPAPTLVDYTNAGVVGVTVANLAVVNAAVDTSSLTASSTATDIQGVVNGANTAIVSAAKTALTLAVTNPTSATSTITLPATVAVTVGGKTATATVTLAVTAGGAGGTITGTTYTTPARVVAAATDTLTATIVTGDKSDSSQTFTVTVGATGTTATTITKN